MAKEAAVVEGFTYVIEGAIKPYLNVRQFSYEFKMKDLSWIHYFLDEIFLGKRKRIITILYRFEMMDSQSMATPVVNNMKKMSGRGNNLDFYNMICFSVKWSTQLFLKERSRGYGLSEGK